MHKSRPRLGGAVSFLSILALDVIRVPEDYPNIQSAIDAAVDGDEVVVGPGTYVENIDFLGKELWVHSSAGPDVTVIDGNQTGSVVTFRNFETNAAVLEAFTITNGLGTSISSPIGDINVGGGVFVSNAAPTIRGNVFAHNGDYWSTHKGGGIYLEHSASPSISHNEFEDNDASLGAALYGMNVTAAWIVGNEFLSNHGMHGIVEFSDGSSATLIGNDWIFNESAFLGEVHLKDSKAVLRGNSFTGRQDDGETRCSAVTSVAAELTITDNTFRTYQQTPVELEGSKASLVHNRFEDNKGFESAGVNANGCEITLLDNQFVGNRGAWGGAVYCEGGRLHADRNRFLLNEGESGGALNLSDCKAEVINNVFARNRAEAGGALIIDHSDSVLLRGNTIADNESEDEAAAIRLFSSAVTMDHCIVWGNTSLINADWIEVILSTIELQHCDVQGGWEGEGNFDLDPVFVDADAQNYRLSAGSPCIDAGDSGLDPRGTDASNFPRLLDGDLDGSMTIDVGAEEFSHGEIHVSGSLAPGRTCTLDARGTAGLAAFFWVGTAPGDLAIAPFGALFLDLSSPWFVIPLGFIPRSIQVPIPSDVPVPLYLTVQALALDASTGRGNFSNFLSLVIE